MYGQRTAAGFTGSGALTVGSIEFGAHVLLWAALVMLTLSTIAVGRRAVRRTPSMRP